MAKLFLWNVLFALLICFYVVQGNGVKYAQHEFSTKLKSPTSPALLTSLWPYPFSVQFTTSTNSTQFFFSNWKNFNFKILGDSIVPPIEQPILQFTVQRYPSILFWDTQVMSAANCPSPQIICLQPIVQIVFDTKYIVNNESYRLSIDAKSGMVTVDSVSSVRGVMRALETLSQLIQISLFQSTPFYTLQIQDSVIIADTPRYSWRGLLIDTSRHFLPLSTIQTIIDGMSMIKLNVLHWHAVDAQSFPLVIDEFPLLSEKGAYDPEYAVYKPEQVKFIKDYAKQRGITVIMEIDVPGHSYSFGKGYPEIVANCPSYAANINNIPLNPASEQTFQVLEGIIKQLSQLFGEDNDSRYMHFGADELVTSCWKEDTRITSFMQQKGFQNTDQLLHYFEQRLQVIYSKYNRNMICWEELLLKHDPSLMQLPKDVVVQVWTQPSNLIPVTQQGYQTVLSGGWYLDKQMPLGVQLYLFDDTWKVFYGNEPLNAGNFTDAMAKLILGGEAAMWSETVSNENIIQKIFPRIMAVAERLWSPKEIVLNDATKDWITNRLENVRCNSLVKRGVKAGPVTPGYCAFTYKN